MASGSKYLNDEIPSQLINMPIAISPQNTSKVASNRRSSASDDESHIPTALASDTSITTSHSGEMEPAYWLQCTFRELSCKMRFDPKEYKTWRSHCLSHWNGHHPPRNCLCIFCDEEFKGNNSWSRRMSHIAGHFAYGQRVEDSRPDSAVYRYMYEKGLLAEAEYITIMKYSECLSKDNCQAEKAPASIPTSKFLLQLLQIITSSACMLFGVIPIHNYEIFGSIEAKVAVENMKDGYLSNNALCIPQILRNPSPAVFIIACISFGLAAISYYHLHINDRHQSQILSSGIKVGLLASVISSLATRDPFDFKTYMPLAILVSLTLSSATHRLLDTGPLITRVR